MYDYNVILCGGGCAGLNLLFALEKQKFGEKVLVIESEEKKKNDRIWSFWDKNDNYLDDIVYKSWEKIHFSGNNYNKTYNIEPYKYKTIRGIDFYRKGTETIKNNDNFYLKKGRVKTISNAGIVFLENGEKFKGKYVFNTTIKWQSLQIKKPYHLLLQHFKGWLIETSKPSFDDKTITYMDFNIPQQPKAGHFIYILPYTTKKALIEYTVFSKKELKDEQYNAYLNDYITNNLKIDDYKVLEEENGVIPMTDYPFPRHQSDTVFNIGTGGGSTKASTGYTFFRVQSQSISIARLLSQVKSPKSLFKPLKWNKYYWYDKVMLNVLYNGKYPASQFFTELFEKKGVHNIFQFLDEQTTLLQDIYFFNIPPKLTFFKALVQEMYLCMKGK